jgi:K+-sensing histidine kinase KdpD
VAVGVAGLLVPARHTGRGERGLVLAIVVAGAAMLGGSVAGVITSLAASLSFDYFHTEPYFDLRIDKRDDVITALLLLVLGVAVGCCARSATPCASTPRSRREAPPTSRTRPPWWPPAPASTRRGR